MNYELTVEASPAALSEVREFFTPLFEQHWAGEANALSLALGECCANIIAHRNRSIDDGKITIRATLEPERLSIRIGNFCTEAEVPLVKPRALDDVKPGGLGTYFVREIMHRVSFEPAGGSARGLSLVLERDFPSTKDSEAPT